MARPRQIDSIVVKRAQRTAATSTSVESLRQCQAVLLPALFGATLEQTAAVLGVGRATVARLQTTFRRRKPAGPHPLRNWGGRRQALLTPEEERAFLNPWLESLRNHLNKQVPVIGARTVTEVASRLLARHGWRKVAPDTRHPKSDPAVQEEWKKNSRKCWRPCSLPTWSKGVTSG